MVKKKVKSVKVDGKNLQPMHAKSRQQKSTHKLKTNKLMNSEKKTRYLTKNSDITASISRVALFFQFNDHKILIGV